MPLPGDKYGLILDRMPVADSEEMADDWFRGRDHIVRASGCEWAVRFTYEVEINER